MIPMKAYEINGVTITPALNGFVLSVPGAVLVVPGEDTPREKIEAASLDLLAQTACGTKAPASFDVILRGKARWEIFAVKAVRAVTGTGLAEARKIVSEAASSPRAIACGLPFPDAYRAKTGFLAVYTNRNDTGHPDPLEVVIAPSGSNGRRTCRSCNCSFSLTEIRCPECGT